LDAKSEQPTIRQIRAHRDGGHVDVFKADGSVCGSECGCCWNESCEDNEIIVSGRAVWQKKLAGVISAAHNDRVERAVRSDAPGTPRGELMTIARTALFALLILCATPSYGDELTPEKCADIERLLHMTGALSVGRQMSTAVVQQMTEVLRKARPESRAGSPRQDPGALEEGGLRPRSEREAVSEASA
jgi:hypothetical protein